MLHYSIKYTSLNESGETYDVEFPMTEETGTMPPLSGMQEGEGCRWTPPNHALFQMAHTALLIAFMAPSTIRGMVFFHGTLVLAYLLLSTWAWAMLCAPDIFSWNFSLMLINSVQVLFIMYQLRPIKFSTELEDVYTAVFLPLRVPRAHVLCHGHFLHFVQEKQFLDSPEFEASGRGDEKFRVSIMAALPCRYICWQRQSLDYLFGKNPYLATVMGHLLGRDITNKLYLLNDKLRAQHGRRVDIRLPSVSTAALTGVDLDKLKVTPGSAGIRTEVEEEDMDEDSMDESDEKTHMFPNGLGRPKGRCHSAATSQGSVSSK